MSIVSAVRRAPLFSLVQGIFFSSSHEKNILRLGFLKRKKTVVVCCLLRSRAREMTTPKIGVLALQGAFREHVNMLRSSSEADVREIRVASELKHLDGLIIPGGESTAFAIIGGGKSGMFDKLKEFVKSSKPVWGTCAGLIVLANRVNGQKRGGQSLVGGLNITVQRNYFGKQVCSFEADIAPPPPSSSSSSSPKKRLRPSPFPGIFIRAPAILETGSDVKILASVDIDEKSTVVAVRQGNLLGTSFHPELGDDTRYHQYFMNMVEDNMKSAGM